MDPNLYTVGYCNLELGLRHDKTNRCQVLSPKSIILTSRSLLILILYVYLVSIGEDAISANEKPLDKKFKTPDF